MVSIISIVFNQEQIQKVQELKDYFGVKNTAELIRILITEKHRTIEPTPVGV